ncbi:MAG: hypothetical protein JSW54_02135 [Fidelibacterota bacterium]|nr:MAG: hypothetical protein JSW54_02135 [Candidatus Neomarinimicrobiota bacterium]
MKRIIDSDYTSMEELVKDSEAYSIDELRDFLNHIITKWEANELAPASINALLRFIYVYLDRPDIQIRYKNCIPIPICYFTPYLPLCASLLYSFLKTMSFAVTLFSLCETDRNLKEYIKKMKPPVVLFSISHFLHVETLKQLLLHLRNKDLKIVIGGIPFVYDENMKQGFSDCVFPEDLTGLTLSLESYIKGTEDERM